MPHVIALLGAGVMGNAIGTRLVEMGHALRVYDPDAAKVAALTGIGAEPAASGREAASTAGFVVLSLNSARIVETAVFGDDGVASGARPGTLIVDMSSIDPGSTRAFAARAAERGLRWVDAPLSGGAPKARVGRLTVMAGGAARDVEDARAVMDDLCANYTFMGPSGAGQTTKLINQVLCALNFMAVAEATRLALDAGVDAAAIPRALAGGRADSAILQEFMGKMAAHDYSPTGRLDNMVKDLGAAQDLARSTGTAMPMTALVAEIHRLLVGAGLGAADNAALMEFFMRTGRETQ